MHAMGEVIFRSESQLVCKRNFTMLDSDLPKKPISPEYDWRPPRIPKYSDRNTPSGHHVFQAPCRNTLGF